jgi:ketosteroid isomerase-like protein
MCAAMMIAVLAGCEKAEAPKVQEVDQSATAATAVRNTAVDWGKAFVAGDVEKVLSYYATNATAMPPDAAVVSTPEERRKLWTGVLTAPGYAATLETVEVVAAKSGELAYERGQFTLTLNDKKGKPATTKGKYLWRGRSKRMVRGKRGWISGMTDNEVRCCTW